jgi:hypothetical protein
MSRTNRHERKLATQERLSKRRSRRMQLEEENPKMKKRKSSRTMNRHHLVNKCNGGTMSIHNILWIYINRHHVWHELFHNLDLDQVIALLIRVKSAKENQQFNHPR